MDGNIIGQDGLFSDFRNHKIQFCNINDIMSEMRSAIERITEMIKAEMPEYLISSEELNDLASDSWFNVTNEYEEAVSR